MEKLSLFLEKSEEWQSKMGCNCEKKEKLLKRLTGSPVKEITYMDYNATTPVLKECLGAFDAACRKNWGNPSSLHPMGVRAWGELEANRKTIASFYKTDPDNLHFCSSASEAIFAAINGLNTENSFFITTAVEHSAVMNNIEKLPPEKRYILKVSQNGEIPIDHLSAVLEKTKNAGRKTIVIYSPVNHETGALQPIEVIYKTAKEKGAFVFLDAVQAAARLPVNAWRPYCSGFALASHKLYAPKGCGVLALKVPEQNDKTKSADKSASADLKKFNFFRYGGNQESSLFPGTENLPTIAAFGAAVKWMKENFETHLRQLEVLTKEGIKILTNIPTEIYVETPTENNVPGIICISIPKIDDMEKFLNYLAERGICISRFSACSEEVKGSSKILTEMGRPQHRSEKSIRISTGTNSTREDYITLAATISAYLK